jgi:hypothetical protein
VQLQLRRYLASEPRQPGILYDNRVHTRLGQPDQNLFGVSEFISEDQGVKRHKASDIVSPKVFHDFRQLFRPKIISPHPGVEPLQPEVDGVRPVRDGRPQAFPVACWTQ